MFHLLRMALVVCLLVCLARAQDPPCLKSCDVDGVMKMCSVSGGQSIPCYCQVKPDRAKFFACLKKSCTEKPNMAEDFMKQRCSHSRVKVHHHRRLSLH